MLNSKWRNALLTILLFSFAGCHAANSSYTDPKYHVTISYPGNLDLIADAKLLGKVTNPNSESHNQDAVDHPELLFLVATPERSQMTCAVHRLPDGMKLTPEEYYQASTAAELQRIGADIVEPKTDLQIGGKTFQTVGFRVESGDMAVRARIYQYLDVKTGRILVLTPTVEASAWDSEIALLDPVISSVRVDW